MPCDDITETIELRLNGDDELVAYRLNKRTCGAEIGAESLLLPRFVGWTAQDVLAFDSHELALLCRDMLEEEEFLYFKHLFALQESLGVLLGKQSGVPSDTCALASVLADEDGVTFRGVISVDGVVRKIKACGRCRKHCAKPRDGLRS